MNQTALYKIHQNLNARIIPFAGYEMPVQYKGITEEHITVRKHAGIFDVSHMGEFLIEGPNALELLQFITANDVSKIYPGKAQYNYLPNEKGGIIDDLLIYQLADNKYFIVVNASNIEKDWKWINEINKNFNASLKNISENTSLLALQGPASTDILQTLTNVPLAEMQFYTVQSCKLAGIDDIIVATTGYTGSGGFEIYCENQYAEKIWNAIMESGQKYGLQPVGLGARDTLRLEMGYCLYGNDIGENTSPIAAGLGWVTKFNKEFIGKEIILKDKEEGTSHKLSAFLLDDKKGIPRQGYEIYDNDLNLIGHITSGTLSPVLQKPIALGYIIQSMNKIGNTVKIKIRNNYANAGIVKLPFYKEELLTT